MIILLFVLLLNVCIDLISESNEEVSVSALNVSIAMT